MNKYDKNKSEEEKAVESVLTVIIFCVLMYYIGIPVWHFIDAFFDVLAGRG